VDPPAQRKGVGAGQDRRIRGTGTAQFQRARPVAEHRGGIRAVDRRQRAGHRVGRQRLARLGVGAVGVVPLTRRARRSLQAAHELPHDDDAVGRAAVAEALRSMDGGPSKYYPLGEIKFDEKGRRVGAGMTIVQWQSGVPVTVFPPQLALAQPFWPKN